jgi:hypothetical protein
LAVGFAVGNGIIGAKIIGGLFTLAALLINMIVCARISCSRLLALSGTIFIAYFLFLPGFMFYESSLIIILINAAIYFTYVNEFNNLTFIWALIPLTRPECTVFVLLNFIRVVLLHREAVIPHITRFLVAMFPSCIYFGYSYIVTGMVSTSSACRGFALRESFSIGNWKEYTRYMLPILPLINMLVSVGFKRFLKINSLVSIAATTLFSVILLGTIDLKFELNKSSSLAFDFIVDTSSDKHSK